MVSGCCACGGRPRQAGCGVSPGGNAPTVYDTLRFSPACSTLVSKRQERCRIRTPASLYRSGRRNLPGFCYRLKNGMRRLTLSFVALSHVSWRWLPSAVKRRHELTRLLFDSTLAAREPGQRMRCPLRANRSFRTSIFQSGAARAVCLRIIRSTQTRHLRRGRQFVARREVR